MFGIEISCEYKGIEGQQFAWKVTLKKGDKTFTGNYRAGFGHCKRVNKLFPKGPREPMTRDLARALKPFGKLMVDDLEGEVAPTPPTLEGYLSCIQLDSRSGEHLLFEDFADEFGYDHDSRKAEKIWRACQETRGQLQKFLGSDFEPFMNTELE